MNLSAIREELQAADDQISRGEGTEYDDSKLHELFAEAGASALQLLHESTSPCSSPSNPLP